MGQHTTVVLVDDLDGHEHTADVLERHALAGRRKGRTPITPGPARASAGQVRSSRSGSSGAERERNRRIREWAREQGHKVSERGRLPGPVVEAYEEAHR